jgi:hypothetical protein
MSKMRWAGRVVRLAEIRILYKIFMRKSEGYNHFGDLVIDATVIKCEDVGSINLAQKRVHWRAFVNTVMCL